MKKAIRTIEDLIQEVKLRTVWWALFIFSVSYFLTRKHFNFDASNWVVFISSSVTNFAVI